MQLDDLVADRGAEDIDENEADEDHDRDMKKMRTHVRRDAT